jgi:hypothetical protein
MIFAIEELKDTIKLFSAIQCSFFSESCIVALEEHSHNPGCKLKIEGDNTAEAILNWSSEVNKAGYQEPNKYVEDGATAISFYLAQTFTDYKVLQEAFIGTGFDYWLGYDIDHESYDPKNFFCARLEISGILKETPQNNLKGRVNIKKRQTEPTDKTGLPAFISVVEFSNPKAYFAKK